MTGSGPAAVQHHSTAFLAHATQLKLALIILNTDERLKGEASNDLFSHLWEQATVRVCADGAANRLHDALSTERRAVLSSQRIAPAERCSNLLPDVITGDLDSIRPEVMEFYERLGVPLVRVDEQDSHDFEKCLRWLQVQQEATGSKQPYSVVAYGAFGGRLDQQMANLNMLFRRDFQCFERFVLLDHHSLALLLAPGAHAIEPCLDVEDGKCGLIPMGGACEAVTTQGLKWNLEGDGLAFGSLVSSSNQIAAPTARPARPKVANARTPGRLVPSVLACIGRARRLGCSRCRAAAWRLQVTVQTDKPLLWTTSIRKQGPPP